ncbi:hypothetical protein GCM10010211_77540 [Streptomyces albospinus]|uniref:DUF7848 domain-containing protein n=1 Tax=Streptomyces albospinus TaxID=285515 RepID=A0ABQ2VN67_9ACTN|nr:hypothetical protein [Streptomyces albospinus]GGU98664.1 hypothetical protein GCM10010211_77540 [Streptomyces albospinus]
MTARERFSEWTLRADPKVGVGHVGRCLICWEPCVDTPSADQARDWCLKHVDSTGHDSFTLTAEEFFDAILTDHPSVNGTSPT